MRVYQVLAPAKFGGAETVCLSLSAALGAAGIRCTVVVLVAAGAPHATLGRAQRLGLDTVVLRHGRRGYLRDARALQQLATCDEHTILHSHLARANLVARAAATLSRRPCVATHHGHSGTSVRERTYNAADRSVLQRMDAVITVSHVAAAEMRDRSSRLGARCVFVPSALVPEPGVARAAALRTLGVPRDAMVLGWMGRFTPVKHPELFVRSVAHMVRHHSLHASWQAVMVGDGPLLAATREVARALGVQDRITFSGFHADAGRLVSAFDAVAITSRSEELPTVLLESLHHGIPVVSTAVGDVPYIAARCGAIRLADANPSSVAAAAVEMLGPSTSRSAMARAGRMYVAHHHAPVLWAERHRELYQLLLRKYDA